MTDFRLVGTTATGGTVPVLVNSAGELVMYEPDKAAPRGWEPWEIEWDIQRVAPTGVVSGLAWSPQLSKFCGVLQQSSNGAMSSTDGKTWIGQTLNPSVEWTGVIWDGATSKFRAVGESALQGYFAESSDGETWTVTTGFNGHHPVSIAVNASGSIRVMLSTRDSSGMWWYWNASQQWNAAAALTDFSPRQVICNQTSGLFVAVGYSETNQGIATSSNGSTWTKRGPSGYLTFTSVCHAPELNTYVAVQADNAFEPFWYSTDAITWFSCCPPTRYDWQRVIWCNGPKVFLALTANEQAGRAAMSKDGKQWRECRLANGGVWERAVWAQGLGRAVVMARSDVLFSAATADLPAATA